MNFAPDDVIRMSKESMEKFFYRLLRALIYSYGDDERTYIYDMFCSKDKKIRYLYECFIQIIEDAHRTSEENIRNSNKDIVEFREYIKKRV